MTKKEDVAVCVDALLEEASKIVPGPTTQLAKNDSFIPLSKRAPNGNAAAVIAVDKTPFEFIRVVKFGNGR